MSGCIGDPKSLYHNVLCIISLIAMSQTVPALSLADFAEALTNPIAYQSKLEKHAQQLAVLEEDFDMEVSQVINWYYLIIRYFKDTK